MALDLDAERLIKLIHDIADKKNVPDTMTFGEVKSPACRISSTSLNASITFCGNILALSGIWVSDIKPINIFFNP